LIVATGSRRTSLADVIEQAVWLFVRFPLSLRMVEDLLAARDRRQP
jgi:transposase-like protein